jgi:hypothetical protein
MAKPTIYSILKRTSELKTENERVEFLRSQGNPTLFSVLGHTFDPRIEFRLPEGDPPYKPSEFDEPGLIYGEMRKFYIFVKGQSDNITQVKCEKLFIDMLEYVHPDDAKVLLAMKDKKVLFKNVNLKLVQKAFPGLVPT